MFEITSIAAKDTFTLPLVNGNDEPLRDAAGAALSVTVYGPGSKAFAAAQAARNQRMLDRMANKSRVRINADEKADESAEFLAACTVSFNGWGYQGAADAPAILAAYRDPTIGFIADQVSKAVGDWANFTKGSSAS
jgi:hypothetical protein